MSADERRGMAVRLVHRQRWLHEVRFGDRAGAEAYAEHYGGGLSRWQVLPAPTSTPRAGAEVLRAGVARRPSATSAPGG